MLWGIKLTGNKEWSGANIRVVERRHDMLFWKNVYHSWLNYFYGMLFNLHWCISFILISSIQTIVDTLVTLYLFVYRWKLEMRNTIEEMNKRFIQITQAMQVAWALTTVPTNNYDQYIWMLMQVVVYFEIIVCENKTFCIMYWT